jgi:hypothetical protein
VDAPQVELVMVLESMVGPELAVTLVLAVAEHPLLLVTVTE